MEKIRRSVFETNSSSTHSITINNLGDLLDMLIPDESGNVILYGGEFGWEVEDYNDSQSKASYLAIYARYYSSEPNLEKILKEVIKEQTKCKKVVFGFSEDYDMLNGCYIDHQSIENKAFHHLFENKEMLRQFIFNPKSVLHTDNDNH